MVEMKKLIIIVLMLGTLHAEIPQYNGPSVKSELCGMKMRLFHGNEKLFDEMIRDGSTFEAQCVAGEMANYYDYINEKAYRVFHYCEQAMTKEEYRKWFSYVKGKRDKLEKKGWLK